MSLTASAAAAVWTVLADDPDDGGERRWEDQTKGQRDLYTQFVISCALGLGAFLSFCVGLDFVRWIRPRKIANATTYRYCDPNGPSYTLREDGSDARLRDYRSFQAASLDGFLSCIESPTMKSCSRPAWTHTS